MAAPNRPDAKEETLYCMFYAKFISFVDSENFADLGINQLTLKFSISKGPVVMKETKELSQVDLSVGFAVFNQVQLSFLIKSSSKGTLTGRIYNVSKEIDQQQLISEFAIDPAKYLQEFNRGRDRLEQKVNMGPLNLDYIIFTAADLVSLEKLAKAENRTQEEESNIEEPWMHLTEDSQENDQKGYTNVIDISEDSQLKSSDNMKKAKLEEISPIADRFERSPAQNFSQNLSGLDLRKAPENPADQPSQSAQQSDYMQAQISESQDQNNQHQSSPKKLFQSPRAEKKSPIKQQSQGQPSSTPSRASNTKQRDPATPKDGKQISKDETQIQLKKSPSNDKASHSTAKPSEGITSSAKKLQFSKKKIQEPVISQEKSVENAVHSPQKKEGCCIFSIKLLLILMLLGLAAIYFSEPLRNKVLGPEGLGLTGIKPQAKASTKEKPPKVTKKAGSSKKKPK